MCLRTSFKIQQRAEKYTTGQTWHFLIRHEETVKHIFTGKKKLYLSKSEQIILHEEQKRQNDLTCMHYVDIVQMVSQRRAHISEGLAVTLIVKYLSLTNSNRMNFSTCSVSSCRGILTVYCMTVNFNAPSSNWVDMRKHNLFLQNNNESVLC